MQVSQAPAAFRPLTIVIEDEDDYDQLMAILSAVADNKINHTGPTIAVAKHWRAKLAHYEKGDE